MNSIEVFQTILNFSKQSGVIGNKSWSCGNVTRSLRSSGGRSVVVNTVGRSRAWSGKSETWGLP